MDDTIVQTLVDRFAIREVIDAYARHADRREPLEQAATFTVDGRVTLYDGDPQTREPLQTIQGRDALASTFAGLIEQYEATTYLNGQPTIGFDHDGRAHGETYCITFHRLREDGQQFLLTMAIRYLD
ncbi:nuclear transport factor 2 family protein [Actinophytocola sp.]|uniref:nuclear transport factor 2 family protein n=1 Tax=Actinophytocola sp. TaxID=1872138 RepID=UPI00389B00CE